MGNKPFFFPPPVQMLMPQSRENVLESFKKMVQGDTGSRCYLSPCTRCSTDALQALWRRAPRGLSAPWISRKDLAVGQLKMLEKPKQRDASAFTDCGTCRVLVEAPGYRMVVLDVFNTPGCSLQRYRGPGLDLGR